MHQRMRQQIAPYVASGEAHCTRCRRRIFAWERWDLDHSDDRTRYLGAAHRSCNRAAGARKGNAMRAAVQSVKSRVW